MRLFVLVLAAVALFVSPAVAQSGSTGGDIVRICETPPDNFNGNCPDAVTEELQELAAQGVTDDVLNIEVGNTAAALGDRLQVAIAENDFPLCIDLAEGIAQTANYSTDPIQRDSVLELATTACCVPLQNAGFGIPLGTTVAVELGNPGTDGATVGGAATFSSSSMLFVAAGVQAGDLLVILSGEQQGVYVIEAVLDENTLTIGGSTSEVAAWQTTESGLEFEIRRASDPLEGLACDPNLRTAAVIIPDLEASPN